MKILITLLCILHLQLPAAVLKYESDYLSYSVPQSWYRKVQPNPHYKIYAPDNQINSRLIVQLFRQRKWAQWHMRGLFKAKKTFQKYFDEAMGTGEYELLDIDYDNKNYILSLRWKVSEELFLLSRMQLTSFGCVAFHRECQKEDLQNATVMLDECVNSLEFPENLRFVPEDITDDILSNMGGAVYFIILSVLYLAFSLYTRSRMRSRRQAG